MKVDKKSTLSYAAMTAVALSLAVSAGYSNLKGTELVEESTRSINALENEIQSRVRAGYIAVTDIRVGERITESLLSYSNFMISDVGQEHFITAEDIGKIATTNISSGMPVYRDMVSDELAGNYHERECSFIWLNSNLADGDNVDVRILFPDGEDYVVVAKKALHETDVANNRVFMWLTEEEIQLLDGAIVDATLHNAKIYVTKYVQPEVQVPSIVNYTPNAQVLAVMVNDPNIVEKSATRLTLEIRKSLDSRLEAFNGIYPDLELEEEVGTNNYYTSFYGREVE